jgi:hypothetical protein
MAPECMLRQMAEAVAALIAERALVLVFDDLQWSDHATLGLIDMLARRQPRARLLIVGADRPGGLARRRSSPGDFEAGPAPPRPLRGDRPRAAPGDGRRGVLRSALRHHRGRRRPRSWRRSPACGGGSGARGGSGGDRGRSSMLISQAPSWRRS